MRKLLPNRMKYIFSSETHKPLGRWSLIHDDVKKVNGRIDMSNEDHCGPCGTSSIEEHIRDVAIKNNNLRIKELKQELKKKRQESMPIKKG